MTDLFISSCDLIHDDLSYTQAYIRGLKEAEAILKTRRQQAASEASPAWALLFDAAEHIADQIEDFYDAERRAELDEEEMAQHRYDDSDDYVEAAA